MKKLLIGCILFLTILAIGVTTIMIFGINQGGFHFSGGTGDNLPLVNTITLPLDDIKDIQINYATESIRIYESDTDEIIIKEYMSKTDEKYYATITQTGSSLTVKHGSRTMAMFLFSRVEVYLPSDYSDALAVSSVSGSVHSDVAFTNSRLDFTTVSGSIRLNSLTADTIALKTTSGSVSASQCNGHVNASTVSGSVKLLGGDYDGNISTTSGSVTAEPDLITGHISLKSVSGSAKLKVTKEQSFSFHASSVSGSIRTWFDDSVDHKKTKATGSVGTDPAFDISISTTSGSIKVYD